MLWDACRSLTRPEGKRTMCLWDIWMIQQPTLRKGCPEKEPRKPRQEGSYLFLTDLSTAQKPNSTYTPVILANPRPPHNVTHKAPNNSIHVFLLLTSMRVWTSSSWSPARESAKCLISNSTTSSAGGAIKEGWPPWVMADRAAAAGAWEPCSAGHIPSRFSTALTSKQCLARRASLHGAHGMSSCSCTSASAADRLQSRFIHLATWTPIDTSKRPLQRQSFFEILRPLQVLSSKAPQKYVQCNINAKLHSSLIVHCG